jgi:hypothetical protein
MGQGIDQEYADDHGGDDELLHPWELLASDSNVGVIAPRLNERSSQFLNFDENMRIQRIVMWRLVCLRRCMSEARLSEARMMAR